MSRPRDAWDQDLVGIGEIAKRLKVKRATVDKWRQRGVLPKPDWELMGGPVWRWDTIKRVRWLLPSDGDLHDVD